MNSRLWLARLGGAQPDVLRQTPNDTPKYTAMGGVLLSTAAVAAASAAFALSSTLGLPTTAAVLVGLAWGVVILNLDRMLIISMDARGSRRRAFATAVPRILLAVLIGAVISTPLVLQIFQKEITSEIVRMQAQERLENKASREQEFKDLPALEADVARLEGVVYGGQLPSPEDDQRVKDAQADVQRKQEAANAASAAASCELSGGGPSCANATQTPGVGEEYRRKADAARNAGNELDLAQRNLRDARAAAEQQIAQNAPALREQAAAELKAKTAERDGQRTLQAQVTGEETDAAQANNGLLAQLGALEQLSRDSALMLTAHLALFLLFMAIEVLPVLVKLLAGFGPPTLYDKLLARRETESDEDDQVRSDQQQSVAEQRARVRLELEQYRADRQIASGKQTTDRLVDEQRRITERAIDVWARVASARSDAELDRWYRQYAGTGGGPFGTAATPASGVGPATVPFVVVPQSPAGAAGTTVPVPSQQPYTVPMPTVPTPPAQGQGPNGSGPAHTS